MRWFSATEWLFYFMQVTNAGDQRMNANFVCFYLMKKEQCEWFILHLQMQEVKILVQGKANKNDFIHKKWRLFDTWHVEFRYFDP